MILVVLAIGSSTSPRKPYRRCPVPASIKPAARAVRCGGATPSASVGAHRLAASSATETKAARPRASIDSLIAAA
jgi:hypothetical protein